MKKEEILVIIDMQNDFIDGTLANPAAQEIVPKIIKKIKSFKGSGILLTHDTHTVDYLETSEGKKLPIKHCIMNTPGWEINRDILTAVQQSGIHYSREKKGTFGDIYLGEKIQALCSGNAPDVIEMCGTCTDICVISNALILRAWFPDTEIIVNSKLCAGLTEELHNAALKVMGSCQIKVV